MRSPFTVRFSHAVQKNSPVRCHVARRCQLVVLLAVLCGLVGSTAATTDALWAQPPQGPTTDDLPLPPPSANPEIIDFFASQYPGEDNWLVSGQIIGCEFPGDIGVAINGVVTASAITDAYGYFEVIVSYAGSVDMAVADADYEGVPLQQVACAIGF